MAVREIRYEMGPCGRCGGSGHYSYCTMYGTVCFGCSGSGKRLTRRGRAAWKKADAWKKANLDLTVAGLRLGDVVEETVVAGSAVGTYWARVTKIYLTPDKYGWLGYESCSKSGRKSGLKTKDPAKSPVRRKLRPEEFDGLLAYMKGKVGVEIVEREPKAKAKKEESDGAAA